MKPVYLSRIEIENFRTYGEGFQVELNPGPGVTLVCGMNGLGKTGFFEALEWALTGDVRRLSEKRKDQLDPVAITRSGAPENSHRVLVQWGDYTLERQGRELRQGADLREFLRLPSWQPQISDVATYLRLTHFLPQASASRFTMLDEPTRWGLLKGPAGVERLERLRLLINDKRARSAFAEEVSRVQTECGEIERKVADWNEAIERRRQLRGFAQAAAAISPPEIIEMLAGPWELISEQGDLMPTSDQSPHGVAARMGLLRERIELRRSRLVEINTKLPYLEEVLNNLVAKTARRAESAALIQRTETETKVQADAWNSAESALRALRIDLRAREEELFEAELVKLESEARRAKEEREGVVREISTLRATLDTQTARLSNSAALINGAGGIENLPPARAGLLRNLAELEIQLRGLKVRIAAQEEMANELKTRLAAARVSAADAKLTEDNRSKQEKALMQAWRDAGLGIEPTIEGFHDWRRGNQAELQSMERALATVIRAVDGLNNWLKHEELRTAEQLIRDTFTNVGSIDEDEYAKLLDRLCAPKFVWRPIARWLIRQTTGDSVGGEWRAGLIRFKSSRFHPWRLKRMKRIGVRN